MQVIIPLAGKGTRLRPHTHLTPKPMLKVAGRPVIDWVMDRLQGLEIDELIFITGHLKEQVEQYCRANYPLPSRFIEQKVQDGTAGAVNLARPLVHGPVMIIFVDTVFEADLTLAARTGADGIIWVKEVEDYQRYGVVVTDDTGAMTRIVEKPSTPVSKLANIGLYFVRNVEALWRGIDHVLASAPNKGEYYLTDAFQHMIDNGCRIETAGVGGWYDCGQLATTLETNGILLADGAARPPDPAPGVRFIEPVLIDPTCTLERCTIGPNVALDRACVVRDATIADTIAGAGCVIERAHLHQAMLGDAVHLTDFAGSGSFGANTTVVGADAQGHEVVHATSGGGKGGGVA